MSQASLPIFSPGNHHEFSSLADFEFMKTIGTGTFGRVILVRFKDSQDFNKSSVQAINQSISKFHHQVSSAVGSKCPPAALEGLALDTAHNTSTSSSQPLSKKENTTPDKKKAEKSSSIPQHNLANEQDASTSNASHHGYYALKMLNISRVIRLKQVQHVKNEKSTLFEIRHPFIVQLYWAYHDEIFLYMLMEYVPGGELFTYLRAAQKFENDKALFYAAEIVSAFGSIHEKDIIYRDLKPENILLTAQGHVKLTDFGFAKKVKDRTWTLCGTPEYLAPEVIQSKGHGKAVDWWSLGILIYEMLAGFPPFFDENPFDIYRKILEGRVEFPRHFEHYAKDIIRRLLASDRTKRLGCLRHGTQDVYQHKWFSTRGFTWSDVLSLNLRPPIQPTVLHPGDYQNFEDYSQADAGFATETATLEEKAMFKDF